jgi:flagellar basal-body rod protein FlgG
MTAQQLNVDTIANNIANVNTTGYKSDRMEFKTLLYQTMERASLDASDNGRPVNLQVGLGVRPIATAKMFTNGSFERTELDLDFAIEGNGFFVIEHGNEDLGIEENVYTRDGSFKLSVQDDGNYLVTSDGYYVLDSEGERIMFPTGTATSDINISESGTFFYEEDGDTVYMDNPIGLVQFPNVQGLESIGNNFYRETSNSGEPLYEAEGDTESLSTVVQGYLEMSNVNIAQEMVDLIVAQRAYDLNSKGITTSDEMLQTANDLKR